jgi:hypothetical protein
MREVLKTMFDVHRGKSACLLGLVLLLGGCSVSSGPKLAPVRGRVSYKNAAVTGTNIYFMPDADKGNNGEMATAIVQEDGSFTLSTYPRGDGVAPGAYRVTLDLPRRPEKDLAPYRKVETTPLHFDVPEEGLTDLDIDLSNPPKK